MEYQPENIDKIDQKILITLDMNARMSLTQLAKICKISRDKAHYRLQRLLQKKILGGFYTLIDVECLGYVNYMVFLKISSKEKEVIEYLKYNKHVNWLVNAEMQWDIVMWVTTKNQLTFINFWKEFNKKFQNSVSKVEISIFESLVHFERTFLTNENNDKQIIVFGGRKEKKIDKINMKILRAISFDARNTLLDISKKVGINIKTLQKRIKNLEKEEIIKGYRTYLNHAEMGYQYYLFLLRFHNTNDEILNKILTYTKFDTYIEVVWKLLGKANLALNIKVKNDRIAREVWNKFKQEFHNYILDYETLILYKQHKFVSFPS